MKLRFTKESENELKELENNPSKVRILKDVRKALGFLELNTRHPSLGTHEYEEFSGPNGEKVYCAYAQQKTSKAYRILWYYGPGRQIISVMAIIPHL